MEYYRIQHSLDNKIVGTFGQIIDSIAPDNWEDKPNFTQNISFKYYEGDVITPKGILYKKAKLTDLLSTVPAGFTPKLLVSSPLKDLLINFNKELFQFFSCDVQDKTLIYEYWLASPLKTDWEFVDFTRTDTLIRKRKPEGGTYQTPLFVNSLESFHKVVEATDPNERWNITVDKINVIPHMDQDIFVLDKVDGGVGYFVSERFKKAVEFHEFTGIEFRPINLNLNEWLNSERSKYYK